MSGNIWRSLSAYESLIKMLVTLGTLWLINQVFKFACFIYLHFLRRSALDRYKQISGKQSTWALVTGASDGIGKGCHGDSGRSRSQLTNLQVSQKNYVIKVFNAVIHGRNEKKLNVLREQLLKQWPNREVRTLVIDAANEANDAAKLAAAVQQLRSLNLKVLINNVGGGAGLRPAWLPLSAQEYDTKRVSMFIDLNARFPTEVTRLLLPQLNEHSPALIMNIGSLASEVPTPYLSIYSGAKAYNKAWSSALNLEMKAEGHDVETKLVLVGMVSSGSEPRPTSFLIPSSRRMAQASLEKVGCMDSIIFGYWPHQLQYWIFSLLPTWVLEKVLIGIVNGEREGKNRDESAVSDCVGF